MEDEMELASITLWIRWGCVSGGFLCIVRTNI